MTSLFDPVCAACGGPLDRPSDIWPETCDECFDAIMGDAEG